MQPLDFLSVFKTYVFKFKGLFFVIFFTGIFVATSTILLPLSVSYFASHSGDSDITLLVRYSVVSLVFLFLVGKLFSFLCTFYSTKLSFISAYKLNCDVIRHIHALPYEYIKNQDIVYLSQRVNNDSQDVINFIVQNFVTILINLLVAFVSLCIVFKMQPSNGMVLLVAAISYVGIYKLYSKLLFRKAFEKKEISNSFFNSLNDVLVRTKYINLNVLGTSFFDRLNSSFSELLNKALSQTWIEWTLIAVGDFIKYATIIAIVCSSSESLADDFIPNFGRFISENCYVIFFFQALGYLLDFGKENQSVNASLSRINEIFSRKKLESGSDIIRSRIESVKLVNVCYASGRDAIIKDFSYEFTIGNAYCISGVNGSGKTTLLNLISRLYMPSSGEIYFNQINSKNVNLVDLYRNKISYLTQDIYLPCKVIEENFRFGVLSSYREKIRYFLDKLNLFSSTNIEHRFVEDLSGGEMQKIAIARQLCKNFDVLILDEPSTGLDSCSTTALSNLIADIKRTRIVIFVTHDKVLESMADHIVRIEK